MDSVYKEIGTFNVDSFEALSSEWSRYPSGSPAEGMYLQRILDEYDVKRALSPYYNIEKFKWIKAHRLRPGQEIKEHSDPKQSNPNAHIVHLVLSTNDEVVFSLDGKNREFKKGHIYEIDNTVPHFVQNKGETDRIHIMTVLYGYRKDT